MTHELYKQVLNGRETVRLVNTRIASSKHQLMTVVCNKKLLSGYDDKRYILDDMITTLPYGHNALQEEMFMRKILRDPDWSSSEDEETNVHFAESTMEQSPPITQHTHSFQKIVHHLIQVLTSVSTVRMGMILSILQTLLNKRAKESLKDVLSYTTRPLNQVRRLVFST